MKVKMILPALTEATSPFWRPIKYSLFPPLGLATLAGYLDDDDDVEIQDEHVETLDLDDTPDLVVIQVYITSALSRVSARRSLPPPRRARGARRSARHVAAGRGGPARRHDLPRSRRGHVAAISRRLPTRRARSRVYRSTIANARRHSADPARSDQAASLSRAELDRRVARLPARLRLLLQGGVLRRRPSFYTQTVDAALAEIDRLPGRHLYFLDDHLFGDPPLRRGAVRRHARHGTALAGRRHRQRRAAPGLLERAVDAGLRSLFVGFETLNPANLVEQRKYPEPASRLRRGDSPSARPRRDDQRQLRLRHGRRRCLGVRAHRGVGDRAGHRDRDVSHPDAVPGHGALSPDGAQGRITTTTGICTTRATPSSVRRRCRQTQLERGYWRAYRDFYRWGSIVRGASAHDDVRRRAATSGVRGGLEEVRAAVGLRDPREARRDDAAGARNDPQRVRPPRVPTGRRPRPRSRGLATPIRRFGRFRSLASQAEHPRNRYWDTDVQPRRASRQTPALSSCSADSRGHKGSRWARRGPKSSA